MCKYKNGSRCKVHWNHLNIFFSFGFLKNGKNSKKKYYYKWQIYFKVFINIKFQQKIKRKNLINRYNGSDDHDDDYDKNLIIISKVVYRKFIYYFLIFKKKIIIKDILDYLLLIK